MSSWFEKLKELKDAGQFIQFVVFIFFIAVMCWFAGRFSAPVTIIEKVARGICWQELLQKDKTEAEYLNGIIGIQSLLGELSALQSIFKHQEEV